MSLIVVASFLGWIVGAFLSAAWQGSRPATVEVRVSERLGPEVPYAVVTYRNVRSAAERRVIEAAVERVVGAAVDRATAQDVAWRLGQPIPPANDSGTG